MLYYLWLDSGSRLAALSEKLRAVSNKCLFAMRLELRLHVFHFLDSIQKVLFYALCVSPCWRKFNTPHSRGADLSFSLFGINCLLTTVHVCLLWRKARHGSLCNWAEQRCFHHIRHSVKILTSIQNPVKTYFALLLCLLSASNNGISNHFFPKIKTKLYLFRFRSAC